MKKITSLLLIFSLIIVFAASCGLAETPETSDTSSSQSSTENPASPWDSAMYKENTELGTGAKTFTLVISAYDKEITVTVKTDEKTVGSALSALNLLEGEEGAYGLYVKKVNGIVADYDIDQTYWAFYIDGGYAMTGVDKTDIVDGTTYKLSREK